MRPIVSVLLSGYLASNVQSVTWASAAATWWWGLGTTSITWSVFGARFAADTSCRGTSSLCGTTSCCVGRITACWWSGPLQGAPSARGAFIPDRCTSQVSCRLVYYEAQNRATFIIIFYFISLISCKKRRRSKLAEIIGYGLYFVCIGLPCKIGKMESDMSLLLSDNFSLFQRL